jgi:hypothetical protein
MWPQIIWFVIALLNLGVELARHGEERTGEHNFFNSLISFTLTVSLLAWGGFFEPLLRWFR